MIFLLRRLDYFHFIIAALSLGIGILMIRYGLPYTLHPDESYIIKDAIKNLVNYSHLQFTSPMSLYNWLTIIWYGFVYCVGLLFHQWKSLTEFQNMIILENGMIFFYGRLLSVLLITAAHFIIYHLIRKISNDRRLTALLILLCFIFNPVLLGGVYWVKFDAATYLASCILLNLFYDYFILAQNNIRNRLYILSIALASVRIEIVCFVLTLIIFDYLKSRRESQVFFNKFLFRSIMIGTVVFCGITFYPFALVYKIYAHGLGEMPLASQKTFEKAIGNGVLNGVNSGKFFSILSGNFIFYFELCFLTLCPSLLIYLISLTRIFRSEVMDRKMRSKMSYLNFYMLVFFAILMLFPYHATHYFVSVSTALLLMNAVIIAQLGKSSMRYLFLAISLVYMISLDAEFLYAVSYQTDMRVLAREYILKRTNSEDLIAIETLSMNGFNPLINECPDVLIKKSETVKQAKNGTGLYYELKSKADSNNCRKILDIFTENYFPKAPHAKEWINNYDLESFAERSPKYYVTTRNIFSKEYSQEYQIFYDYISSHYKLEKSFEFHPCDYRLQFLISTEDYFRSVYFYSKNN